MFHNVQTYLVLGEELAHAYYLCGLNLRIVWSAVIGVFYAKGCDAMSHPKKMAVEFVRHVLKHNPDAKSFAAIYDAMAREASARSFHNLGYDELAVAGISFSLLDTSKLERVISEAQKPPEA